MVKSQVIYKDYSKDAERTALVSGENLSHAFGKIARWYTDISWVGHTHTVANITDFPLLGTAASKDVPASGDAGNNEVVMGNDSRLTDARTPTSHTHAEADISDLGTYAEGATKGGPATSANKLNIGSTDIGSETKPVYFNATTGKPVACAYSLNASVPANAVFTDVNVKQSPSTANESREILFAGNTGNTETTSTVGKSNKLYFNPNTGALTATSFSGSIAASNLTGTIDAGRLPTTSVTAGSYGPAAGGTLAHGGTFDAAYVTVDKYGRLTAASTKTFTLPAQYVHPTYTSKTSGLYKITVDSLGHVSGATAATASDLPSHTHPYIPLSGSTAITGELRVTMGETAMPTISVNNGTYRIGIHVGSGGVNHGIYDFSTGINTWMCYHNGTEFLFNGKANTAGKWATARTLTIGSTGKSVDGSGNVSWSLSEIGAAPTSHTHQYAKSSSINGPAYSVEGWEGTDAIYRHVWFSTSTDETRRAYNDNFMYSPTQGTLKFTGWIPVDLTSKTVDLNTYNDSTGVYRYRRYICTTTGGGSNISNKAVDAPFVLEVILIRWASTTDYITKQIYHGFDKKTYQRFCTNGTWSAWTEQKYTDTVYTHPSYTAKTSGLYKITVDATGHVSGTAAVAASDLPAHTHTYLPLTGGTMTGAITFQVADAIKYNASSTTTNMISFITGASDGHGVRIGGGGLVVIGSGESSTALVSALSLTGNTEQTYIASDNNITFYSKCQTIGERLGIVYDNSGRLRPDTDNTRTLGGTDFYWNKAYITQVAGRGTGGSWILSRDNAIVRQSSMSTNSAYFPVISAKTKLGEWSVGTLGPSSEHFYLSYTLDTNYSAGTNTAKTYYISTDGWFNGTAAKADAWTTARTLTLTGSVTGSASIDGSGNVSLATTTNHTHSQYLPLAGGTMSGILNLWSGRYDDNYALNCNNSTIIGANAIKFADLSDSAGEGIMFYRSTTTWDSVWAKNGVLYFTPNHPTDTTNNVVYHSGNLSISRSLTSGTKIATITLNGTATDLYCQTNTNTDTLVTQTNTTADGQYRVVLSGTNDDTTRTETARKSVNLRFNPGTSRLFLRGTTTGDTAYGSTNPAIRFENSNASQTIELLFTDFDAIVNPASLVLIGNQGNESFLAPNIRAWDYTNNKQTAALSCQTVGTTSTVGVGRVALGNSIASGTAGNAKGSVLIYGANSYYVNLQTATLTGSREINLPDIGGTMTGIIYKATDYYATSDHKHGLLHTNLTVTAPNNTTNTWATIGADGTGFVLKSIRTQANAAAYMLNNYAAGIVFGGSDTRGVITHSYDAPAVRFAGGNATATEGGTAKWYFTLKATSAQTYTLPASGGTLTDIIYKASDYYATSGHTHSYLPLSGGTMTGDINFTAVTSTEYPAKSKQIYFSGSTDWAKIYYQVDASDAGRLVFDIGDDTNTRIVFANSGTAKSYIDANGNFSGNAATATTATTTASTSITIQTGSSKLSHITLETLITWLITTKGYVSKTKNNYTVLQTTWAYADNDILQVSINSTNYEIQLAGVIMEFWGCPTGYNSGLWRMRIHTPPTTSYTPASGYTNIGASRVVEYTCNGSGYSPVWRLIEIAGHTHSYAGSSSVGGSATRAVNSDNCKVTVSDPSSATNYGILFVADPNTTEDNMLRKSNNFRVKHFVGAANTEGKTELIIGNAVAKTAANNCSGFIYLYNSNGKNACLKPNTNSSDITLTLPSATGTLALVGDNNHTHSYAGSSSAGGAATSANKLNTNAGTATNPVYFSGGVPVACTYSLQRTVLPNYSVNSSNTANYPYHLLCSMKDTTAGYKDYWAVFRVTPGYHGQYSGVYKVAVRMNNGSASSVSVNLLSGYPYLNDVAKVVAGYSTSGTNTYLYVFLVCPTYARTTVSLLQNGNFTFYSSNEVADTTTSDKKTSVNVYASLAAAGTALVGGSFANTITSITVTNYANVVSTAVTDPSSSTSYGILFTETPNTSQCNYIRKSNDFRLNHYRGAANTEGLTEIVLGNSTASTAANNSTGRVTVYNAKGAATQIVGNTNTSTVTITLPSSTGTLALTGHTHSYLPLSGGTMTGAITFQVADAIKYNASSATYSMISFITGTADGHGIRIGGGGAVVIGSGESSTNLVSALSITGQGETTYVSSDNNIEFYSGCQTIANRKRVTIDSNGHIIIGNNQRILQNQNDTSNYSTAIRWCKNSTDPGNYGPEIGQHNTGDTDGSICILPYHTTSSPWEANVGLYISKTRLRYNGTAVSLSGHTHDYLPLSGGTISSSSFGPLVIKRTGSTNGSGIKFYNQNGSTDVLLGAIGMSGTANGGLIRWNSDLSTSYKILDTGNFSVSRSLTSGTKIATITVNGTATDLYCQTNTNTDTLVTQTNTTADGQYRVVLSGTNDDTTRTETARKSVNLRFNPGTSRLFLRGTTTASVAYGSTNPAIRFENSNASQNIELILNDFDSICKPASLAMIGNQGGEYLLAPNISAWDFTNNRPYVAAMANRIGTTSTNGLGLLEIGNGIASGTAGNAYGILRLFSSSAKYADIVTNGGMATAISIVLPPSGGTMTDIVYKPTSAYSSLTSLFSGSTTITSGLQKTAITLSNHFNGYKYILITIKYNSSPATYAELMVPAYNDTWLNDTVSPDPGGANSGVPSSYTSTDLVGVYYTSSTKQLTFNCRNSMIVYAVRGCYSG